MSTATISVPEISCVACKDSIEGALGPLRGVREAVVDVAAKRVRVSYDEALVDVDQLIAAIEGHGFSVEAQS